MELWRGTSAEAFVPTSWTSILSPSSVRWACQAYTSLCSPGTQKRVGRLLCLAARIRAGLAPGRRWSQCGQAFVVFSGSRLCPWRSVPRFSEVASASEAVKCDRGRGSSGTSQSKVRRRLPPLVAEYDRGLVAPARDDASSNYVGKCQLWPAETGSSGAKRCQVKVCQRVPALAVIGRLSLGSSGTRRCQFGPRRRVPALAAIGRPRLVAPARNVASSECDERTATRSSENLLHVFTFPGICKQSLFEECSTSTVTTLALFPVNRPALPSSAFLLERPSPNLHRSNFGMVSCFKAQFERAQLFELSQGRHCPRGLVYPPHFQSEAGGPGKCQGRTVERRCDNAFRIGVYFCSHGYSKHLGKGVVDVTETAATFLYRAGCLARVEHFEASLDDCG